MNDCSLIPGRSTPARPQYQHASLTSSLPCERAKPAKGAKESSTRIWWAGVSTALLLLGRPVCSLRAHLGGSGCSINREGRHGSSVTAVHCQLGPLTHQAVRGDSWRHRQLRTDFRDSHNSIVFETGRESPCALLQVRPTVSAFDGGHFDCLRAERACLLLSARGGVILVLRHTLDYRR